MVDFSKNCGLSRLGRDANKSMGEFLGIINTVGEEMKSKILEEKKRQHEKPQTQQNQNKDYGLYF